MSALSLYGSIAALLVASALVGRAVLALAGWREWSWLEPALGLATLTAVAALTVRLPSAGVATGAAIGALVVASLVVVWRRGFPVSEVARSGLLPLLLIVLAASVPFAASGRIDVLGPLFNSDLGFHLYKAEWLRTQAGAEPVDLVQGYPLGPYGLVVGLSEITRAGLPASFTALLIAVAGITALTSLAMFRDLPAGRRTLGAALVGLPYLGASYYIQSSFKETLMGLFVLAFALGLRAVVGEGRLAFGDRRPHVAIYAGVPLGLLVAASVHTFSVLGTLWAAGTLAAWALAWLFADGQWRQRAAALAGGRRSLALLVAGILVLLLALGPEAGRIGDFAAARQSSIGPGELGNLYGSIQVWEVLGLWPDSDFRGGISSPLVIGVLAAFGLAALALGVARLARHRELALLGSLAAAAAVYIGARFVFGDPYVDAKALAIASPLVMLVALLGLMRGPTPAASVRTAFLIGFAALAATSSYAALAGAHVGNGEQVADLARLRPAVEGKTVLFTPSDEFAAWQLRGAESVLGPVEPDHVHLQAGLFVGARPGDFRTGTRFDFDSLTPEVLDLFDFVITPRASYGSEPPPNFRPVRSTAWYTLWRRAGSTPARETLAEGELPGAVLACTGERRRMLSKADGIARINSPQPAFRDIGEWRLADGARPPGDDPGGLRDGQPLHQTLDLSPGRWRVSVQYWSTEPISLAAQGWHAELPPNLSRLGPYWPAGSLRVRERGPVDFIASVQSPSPLRKLVGGPSKLRTGPYGVVGGIVATRPGAERTVPFRSACERFIDWYLTG